MANDELDKSMGTSEAQSLVDKSTSLQHSARSSKNPVEMGGRFMSIKLESVHFSYPLRPEQPALNGVELTIGKGQTITLGGPSGCGNSTLAGLLQRFYDPSRGRIFIDDADVKTLDIKELR
jgi:ATP-binding cassette subfamily B protein